MSQEPASLPWSKLPSHWRRGRVKNVATVTLGKMMQGADSGSDVQAPYMRAANVQPDGVLSLNHAKSMWFAPAELQKLTVEAGDVVVVEGGQGGFGRAAYVNSTLEGWGFQNSINRLRISSQADGRFVAYYLISTRSRGFIKAFCNAISMPHLTAEKLASVPIPLPALDEQRAIADFLDRETAQIDTLIAKQEQLIGTVLERRAATIQDRFPSSGRSLRLRGLLALAQTGPFGTQLSASEYVNGGVAVINPSHIQMGSISADPSISVSMEKAKELSRHQFRVGDLVLGRKGEIDKSALIGPEQVGMICGSDSLLLRPSDLVDPDYLWWFLQSPGAHSQLEQLSVGSTVGGLSQRAIAQVVVPVPLVVRQVEVATELYEATSRIDGLIKKVRKFVALAKEQRAALITAAVTGQIDVTAA